MARPTDPTPISESALDHVSGGNMTLIGGRDPEPATNDIVTGTTGNDELDGGKGSDWVFAGPGNDRITVTDGADTIYGEVGDDTAVLGYNADGSFFNGGPGTDVLWLMDNDILTSDPPVIDSTTPYRIEGNKMVFEGPASGSVTWLGMTVHFKNIEVVHANGWVPAQE